MNFFKHNNKPLHVNIHVKKINVKSLHVIINVLCFIKRKHISKNYEKR